MKKVVAILAVAGIAATLAACGGGGGSSTTLKLTADPSGAPKFDQSSLTADAGKITIDLTNPSAAPVVVAVKDQSGKVFGKTNNGKYITHGTASTNEMDLNAGTYIFYNTYDGTEDKGMKGILTVK